MLVLFVMAAMVQPAGSPSGGQASSAEVIAQVEACRAIGSDEGRLACYDKAARALTEAVARKDLVVLDRQQVRDTRRSLFGFSLPRLPLFGGGDGDDGRDDAAQIETKIASLRSLGYGKWMIGLPDGATWQTTDSVQSKIALGQAITIKKGTLGGYFIRIGGRSVRGMRTH